VKSDYIIYTVYCIDKNKMHTSTITTITTAFTFHLTSFPFPSVSRYYWLPQMTVFG